MNFLPPILSKQIIFLFFGAYLVIGLFIYDDYGISWDEHLEREHGMVSLDYINHCFGDFLGEKKFLEKHELSSYPDRDHGHTFSIIAFVIERALDLQDNRSRFLMRHLLTFLLFWWSTIFFFRMLRLHFKNESLALLICTFLILSPRIFAHSFYNAKDAIFLSLFIISSYAMLRYIDRPSFRSALFFAIATAFLISMRVVGVLIPVLTIGFFCLKVLLKNSKKVLSEEAVPLFVYILTSILLTIAIWPFLWEAPLQNFLFVFKSLSNYNWGGVTLLFNNFYAGTAVPWFYTLAWIGISTPILYLLLFLTGLWPFGKSLIRLFTLRASAQFDEDFRRAIIGSLFFVPLAAVMVLKSTLYDGWRQMFFIYPAFLVIVGEGLTFLFYRIENYQSIKGSFLWVKNLVMVFIAASLFSTVFFMVKDHPYQNVYFNLAAGTDIDIRYHGDYWGLSNRQVLEHLLEIDKSEQIKYYPANWSVSANLDILLPEQRKRLIRTSYEEATYFISNHRSWSNHDRFKHKKNPFDKVVFEITVNGNVISGVYLAEGRLDQ